MCNKLLILENDFFHLYYDSGIYLKKNSAAPERLILKNAYKDFDAVQSGDGCVHIICQDSQGNIIYLKVRGEKEEKRVLLVSKNKHAYNKNFRIINSGRLILAFYTIVKDLKTMLVFHCLSENSSPEIIDYITPAPSGFFTYTEPNSDIKVFYTKEDSNLGFREYIWSKKAFSPFNPILENAVCPATSDGKNLIFLKDGKLCMKKVNEESQKAEKTLCHLNCDTPPLCFGKYVFFKRGGVVYYSDITREKPPERLFSPNMIPSLFEIKREFNKCDFLFGEAKGNKINFLSPVPVSVRDFFKNKRQKESDTLKLIFQKLEKIERLLGGM